MASPLYGPAVVIQRPDFLAPHDFTASVFVSMIRHYISEFNITPADDFALVVFRRASDCARFCAATKCEVEDEHVRYLPGGTILM